MSHSSVRSRRMVWAVTLNFEASPSTVTLPVSRAMVRISECRKFWAMRDFAAGQPVLEPGSWTRKHRETSLRMRRRDLGPPGFYDFGERSPSSTGRRRGDSRCRMSLPSTRARPRVARDPVRPGLSIVAALASRNSPSISRGRAGSSTIRTICGGPPSSTARAALARPALSLPARSPPSASPTSARRPSSGTARTGRPIHNAIVWQDRRTADLLRDGCRADGAEPGVDRSDGSAARSVFLRHQDCLDARPCRRRARPAREQGESAVRHRRQLADLAAHRRRAPCRPTPPTPRARCSTTSATGAGTTICWRCFDVPAAMLPEVRDCAADFGTTDAGILRPADPDPAALPATSRPRRVGQACFEPGMLKSTYGTGCLRAPEHR